MDWFPLFSSILIVIIGGSIVQQYGTAEISDQPIEDGEEFELRYSKGSRCFCYYVALVGVYWLFAVLIGNFHWENVGYTQIIGTALAAILMNLVVWAEVFGSRIRFDDQGFSKKSPYSSGNIRWSEVKSVEFEFGTYSLAIRDGNRLLRISEYNRGFATFAAFVRRFVPKHALLRAEDKLYQIERELT